MSKFDPTSMLSSRASMAEEGAITRMAQRMRDLRAKGHDVVSMTIGEPDFDTPDNIRAAAKRAIDQGFTHYAPIAGTPELREAIAHKFKTENGLGYRAADIVVSNGAKQSVANAMLSIIGPGDEAIVLAPYWLSYAQTIQLAGGVVVELQSNVSENYKVPVARIAAAITNKTKLLVLNSPSNPTGAVWSRMELEALAAVVAQHPKLMVISDEIYEYIVFDGEFVSFGALPGMLERTITINGFSKGFAMTGWRLGYAAAIEPVAKAISRMQNIVSAGANMFVQKAALAALQGPRDDVEKMRRAYQLRRDMMVAGLRSIPGIKISDIAGAFYAFPDVSAFLGKTAGNHVIKTVEELCDFLLDDHGIATVPGSGFGSPHSIRLSFATGEAEIKKALRRLAQGLVSLK